MQGDDDLGSARAGPINQIDAEPREIVEMHDFRAKARKILSKRLAAEGLW